MSDAGSSAPAPVRRRVAVWIGWVVSLLPVMFMLRDAYYLLAASPDTAEFMGELGIRAGLLRPLGIVELLCLAVYLFPRTAILGAVLLTGYLGGATETEVRTDMIWALLPLALGLLAWLGVFLREPRLRALLPIRHRDTSA